MPVISPTRTPAIITGEPVASRDASWNITNAWKLPPTDVTGIRERISAAPPATTSTAMTAETTREIQRCRTAVSVRRRYFGRRR